MTRSLRSSAMGVLACALLCFPVVPLNAATRTVVVGDPTVNGGLSFVDAVTHTNNTVINVGDTVHWSWGTDPMKHSTTSGTCVGAVCQSTPYWNSGEFFTPNSFDRVYNNPGVFPYFCTVHDAGMVGTLRVLPTSATFTLQTPATNVGTQPLAVAVGDFRRIGKLDLAVANSSGNTVAILLGNGDGTFTNASGSPITGFNSPASIAIAQFRTVGNKLDLAVVNTGNNTVTILLGNGDGTFTAGSTITLAAGQPPTAIIAGDFDGDGKQDLAVSLNPASNPTQNNVVIFRGNGDGTFVAPVFISTGGSTPNSLTVFDFNSDGKPDLTLANGGTNNLSVLLNTSSPGSVSFGTATNVATGNSPHGIVAGSFTNSQGNPTPGIAVANQNDNTLSVFLENSMGNFVAASGSPFNVGVAPVGVVTGDLNGDGYLDLAVANSNDNSVTTLMNDAAGSFTSLTTTMSEAASSPRAIAQGDFNGDGKADLALANFATGHVSILLNGTAFPPTSPGPAAHFGITVTAGPLTPEGNPSTTAGVVFQITVTAYDAYQKVATGYNGIVHFTSSDGQAMLPGDYTFTTGVGMDNGVHTFNVTLKTADFQTIEVRDTLNALINARSSDILVNPAPTSAFIVTAPASAVAGNFFNFTVAARDPFGNRTPNYPGTVQFSSSDVNACVALPMPATLTNGFGNFSAKLITVGSQTLTARDSLTSSITGMATITIQTGMLHFTVTPSVNTVVIGTPISITVSARDVCEVLQTSYVSQAGHPVHFNSTDLAANVPADYLFTGGDGGTHTFTSGVTFHNNGDQTVTANDTFNQFFGTSPVVHVLGATTLTLAALPKPFLLRNPMTLIATVSVTPPSTGTPTGTVTFFDGGVPLATRSLNGSQQATYTGNQWTYTRHVFTAIYNGDANFAASPSSPPVAKSPRPH